jgi:hypothetical protein
MLNATMYLPSYHKRLRSSFPAYQDHYLNLSRRRLSLSILQPHSYSHRRISLIPLHYYRLLSVVPRYYLNHHIEDLNLRLNPLSTLPSHWVSVSSHYYNHHRISLIPLRYHHHLRGCLLLSVVPRHYPTHHIEDPSLSPNPPSTLPSHWVLVSSFRPRVGFLIRSSKTLNLKTLNLKPLNLLSSPKNNGSTSRTSMQTWIESKWRNVFDAKRNGSR